MQTDAPPARKPAPPLRERAPGKSQKGISWGSFDFPLF